MDWKDALSQLKTDTPEPATTPEPELTAEPAADPLAAAVSNQRGKLIIEMERKGRGGKTATIISGFSVDDEAVSIIASHLKRSLGTGGSARGGEILIQGDRRDAVREALRRLGLKTN